MLDAQSYRLSQGSFQRVSRSSFARWIAQLMKQMGTWERTAWRESRGQNYGPSLNSVWKQDLFYQRAQAFCERNKRRVEKEEEKKRKSARTAPLLHRAQTCTDQAETCIKWWTRRSGSPQVECQVKGKKGGACLLRVES